MKPLEPPPTPAAAPSDAPLALVAPLSGVHLIEASAGTGKTWTIAGLYLRLVLERGLAPEQILVVTFTNAATAELRERLRARLAQMLERIDAGACAEPFCDALYQALGLADADRRAQARRQLAFALHAFDDAAISTIHGFCQRALADRAFSSALPFELELMPDPSALLEQTVADFWRRKIVAWDPDDAAHLPAALHARYAQAVLAGDAAPAALAHVVQQALGRHQVRIAGADAPDPEPGLDARIDALWTGLRAHWAERFAALARAIAAEPGLAKSYRRDHLASRAAKCEAALAAPVFEGLDKRAGEAFGWFRHSTLAEKAGAGFARDPLALELDELFALAGRYEARAAQWRIWTRTRCIAWARQELPARMRTARAQSFDDLLANLHAALAQSAGGALARTLAERYPAALIDEFQDTDPLQFDTFRRIYGEAPAGRTALFFVGDPKQAIYSFRGADLYAYLDAGRWARALPPLLRNFRSTPRMIEAVNAVFLHPAHGGRAGLRMPGLHFEAARAGTGLPPLRVGGRPVEAPLVIDRLDAGPDGKPLAKTEARARVAEAVAAQIARLLDPAEGAELPGAELPGAEPPGADGAARPLAGRDVAVLVGNHAQGELVRRALARRGFASALRSRANVWASDEARQLLRLFAALAELRHEGLVRAALAGDLIGLDAHEIAARERDEALAQAWRERLERWRALARRQGALALLRTVLVECGAYARLAAGRDGERRLTNLAHLAELIGAAQPQLHGLDALVAWLHARVADPPGGEEAELRLESDENLVQIVTIHKSKGLEYEVVFAPFLWEGLRAPGASALYHEEAEPHRAVFALAPDALAQARAQSERYDENLRLAYVALTRARRGCRVAWAHAKDAQTSPLAWLLFGGGPDADALPPAAEIDAQFDALAREARGSIALEPLAAAGMRAAPAGAGAAAALAAAPVARMPPPALRSTSFSGLMHGAAAAELPDHDQFAPAAASAPRAAGALALRFAFPRGPAAGDCLHAIAERIDWQGDARAWIAPIRTALRAARYDDRVAPEALAAWLDEVRRAPLDGADAAGGTPRPDADRDAPPGAAPGEERATPPRAAHPQAPGLRLADVPRAATRRELAFMLPLARARFSELAARARAAGYPVPELAAERWEGLLRGYIDLVFTHAGRVYIADYKSNHLGDALEDYGADALADAMHAHGYHLQHLLYTVAVDRWLRARIAGYDYERDFGGVRYLFLRGMSPEAPGGGVVALRAPRALIASLSDLLDGRAGAKEAA